MADEEQHYTPPFHERDDTIGVSDQFEMITRFAMEQNLAHYRDGNSKLSHINKNLLFTNLKRQHKEPELVINQLKNITILKRFNKPTTQQVFTGQYTEEKTEQGTVMRPIFVEQTVDKQRFTNLIDYGSTKLYGITSTAAGTDGKLLETLKSTFLHKEQSIEDKTQTTGGLWKSMKKK